MCKKPSTSGYVSWQNPMGDQDILEQVDIFSRKGIDYKFDIILGFPGTNPHQITVDVYKLNLHWHANNIGMHTNPSPSSLIDKILFLASAKFTMAKF